ncbi:hypothetical protein KP509_10G088400 [Ceratopteris richardii]|uniref:Auxin efflux carrier component n=2 Tax=Ceratopteris richardii TaxID=49495 RepID=A0A8T2U3M9_CERRI|nr:hypothetical protein KP509_10G088400 [Ceratopteris richardii]
MITINDFYNVMSAMVPLYAAMVVAYCSVRWWKIFTPVQCAGINRFVAVFAVPLLSFHFISTNDPYEMDGIFLLADTISKIAVLIMLAGWAKFSKNGSLDWMITLFALATLPNTLVMGIPLLSAMYGEFYGGLMVQLVVLQCIIWYTLMLFLFEYRAARLLVMDQFPYTAASIVSFRVDPDVMSLDGREALQTQADTLDDGKMRVTIRKSTSSRTQLLNSSVSPLRSPGLMSMPSSKAITPRISNLTGVEIYSAYSSKYNTPKGYGFATPDALLSMPTKVVSPRQSNFTVSDAYSAQSSREPTPRASDCNEDSYKDVRAGSTTETPGFRTHRPQGHTKDQIFNSVQSDDQCGNVGTKCGSAKSFSGSPNRCAERTENLSSIAAQVQQKVPEYTVSSKLDEHGKELHMFVWSAATSPVSDTGAHIAVVAEANEDGHDQHALYSKGIRINVPPSSEHASNTGIVESPPDQAALTVDVDENFSFRWREKCTGGFIGSLERRKQSEVKTSTISLSPKLPEYSKHKEMPPTLVMAKLILQMVGRKLIRNPNTYSSLIGLAWALVSFRWHVNMPKMISNSILILSDAGLGMAMFSLGLFMALQPSLMPCGSSLATFAMAVRFLTGPAAMAASSIAVGLRGVHLHAAIVQAALPQGIVPFVFAREYDLHPDILSTAVIFGMLVALPTTLLYYVFLGI